MVGIELDKLQAALQRADAVYSLPPRIENLAAKARVVLKLRSALLADEWPDVESTLDLASALECAYPEVQAARELVAHRRAVGECTAGLIEALETVDKKLLDLGMEEARRLRIQELRTASSCCAAAARVVEAASSLVSKIEAVRTRLDTAIRAMALDDMIAAVEEAHGLGLKEDDIRDTMSMLDVVYPLVTDVRECLQSGQAKEWSQVGGLYTRHQLSWGSILGCSASHSSGPPFEQKSVWAAIRQFQAQTDLIDVDYLADAITKLKAVVSGTKVRLEAL